jgi:hypothetical protein
VWNDATTTDDNYSVDERQTKLYSTIVLMMSNHNDVEWENSNVRPGWTSEIKISRVEDKNRALARSYLNLVCVRAYLVVQVSGSYLGTPLV